MSDAGAVPASAEKLALWRWKPGVMVRELFGATPDAWQDDVLEMFPHEPRIGMEAAKGPGKTTTLSWCAWNYMLTRPDCNVAATSITGDNLKDGLWKEMAVWQAKSKLLTEMFDWTSTRISRKGPRGNRWFMTAKTWSKSATQEQLGNTMAGFHAPSVLFLLDETGDMPPAILMSAEAVLANLAPGKEAHVVIAGNTISTEGALYDACVRHKGLWKTVKVTGDPDNPKRSPRMNIEWARGLINEFGRDNPFVKIMVLGEWPTSAVNALCGEDLIREAMSRQYREEMFAQAAKILSVDVAREGDDASVRTKRQGRIVFPQRVWRNVTGIEGGAAINLEWNDWDADACFIDMSGGHGTSWFDHLTLLGKAPIAVYYSGKPHNDQLYKNKRAEMHFDAVNWLRTGGQLPPTAVEILQQLPRILYTHDGDKLMLEPKKLYKMRVGFSPDHTDSFVQTFAEPVSPKKLERPANRRTNDAVGDYDVFADAWKVA